MSLRFDLGSGDEQVAATNVSLHVDMPKKPLAIDCCEPVRPKSFSAFVSPVALRSVHRASRYADRLRPLDRREQELLARFGLTIMSA